MVTYHQTNYVYFLESARTKKLKGKIEDIKKIKIFFYFNVYKKIDGKKTKLIKNVFFSTFF